MRDREMCAHLFGIIGIASERFIKVIAFFLPNAAWYSAELTRMHLASLAFSLQPISRELMMTELLEIRERQVSTGVELAKV